MHSVSPSAYFATKDPALYSKIDEKGMPTHLANGDELKKAQLKKLAKELKKHTQKHQKLVAKAASAGLSVTDLIAKAKEELEKLQQM